MQCPRVSKRTPAAPFLQLMWSKSPRSTAVIFEVVPVQQDMHDREGEPQRDSDGGCQRPVRSGKC
jgi:hypothetical protein